MTDPKQPTLSDRYRTETGFKPMYLGKFTDNYVLWLSSELTNETNALHACEETLARVSNDVVFKSTERLKGKPE